MLVDQLPLLMGPMSFSLPFTETSYTVQAVNGVAEGVGWVFQARDTDAITHVGFSISSITGTSPVYSVTIESLDANGLPSGTDVGGGSPTLTTFTPGSTGALEIALTNPYTPAFGELFVVVIRYSSGTIDASNFTTFGRSASFRRSSSAFPYSVTNTGAGWSRQLTNDPQCYVRTANRIYGNPVTVGGMQSGTVSTDGHRHALRFTLPSGHPRVRICGMHTGMKPASSAGNATWAIWDSGGTPIATATGLRYGSITANSAVPVDVLFTTQPWLTPGDTYYIGAERNGSNLIVRHYPFAPNTVDVCCGPGWDLARVTDTGSGWTVMTDTFPTICPLISEIETFTKEQIATAMWAYDNRTLTA